MDKRVFYLGDNQYKSLKEELLDDLYPLPKGKKYIGITGTNGKTSTVDFLRQIAAIKNINSISFGTAGFFIGRKRQEGYGLTSPSEIFLRKQLYRHSDAYELVFMEVSSHAIDQQRFGKIVFDAIGWTSFSRDHLDYHKTEENYFQAKLNLRKYSHSDFVISKRNQLLYDRLDNKIEAPNLEIKSKTFSANFNKVNIEVAVGVLKQLGISVNQSELEQIEFAKGRYNVFVNKKQIIIVDYAHTPDALENVIKAAKYDYKNDIVVVFGCGGDRDHGKRKLMGSIIQKLDVFAIVTTDNPRSEEPQSIISEITSNLHAGCYIEMEDRKEAIEYALKNKTNATIIIAGKGDEDFIEFNDKKVRHNDIEFVKKWIAQNA